MMSHEAHAVVDAIFEMEHSMRARESERAQRTRVADKVIELVSAAEAIARATETTDPAIASVVRLLSEALALDERD